jgi:ESCRT-II complex subunit VPS22
MKILDICSKRRSLTGGLMKISDVIDLNNRTSEQKILRNDVERALSSISCLGSGCCIFKGEYVCTVPFILSDDTADLMNVAEEFGHVSFNLMRNKRGWNEERYKEKTEFAIKEGLVWVDRKTGKEEMLYFPSMMTTFVNEKARFLPYFK